MTIINKKNLISLGVFLIFILLSYQQTIATEDEIAIITGVDSNILALDIDDIRLIFLKEKTIFIQDKKIEPINLSKETSLRKIFDSHFIGKTEKQFTAHWAKMIFIGEGNPPMELPDEDSVKRYVNVHPNSIGYIKRSNVDETVKALYFISPGS